MGDLIPVVEIFGPTIQGEGPHIGSPCHFIRFGGCDFKCGWSEKNNTWVTDGFVCDSLHAVLPSEVRKAERLDALTIVDRVRALPGNPGWVVLSGGNPLLHELGEVVKGLHEKGFKVSVETQGSLYKAWLKDVDHIVISPKPPSSQIEGTIKLLGQFLDQFGILHPPMVLKVPILDERDLDFARNIVQVSRLPLYLSVTNVHGGIGVPDAEDPGEARWWEDTTEELLERFRWIHAKASLDPLLSRAVILPQLHVLIWGNARGR